ncbi:MAG: winged helix-turn-helix domain-containing protein [Phenylobacterium sp.]
MRVAQIRCQPRRGLIVRAVAAHTHGCPSQCEGDHAELGAAPQPNGVLLDLNAGQCCASTLLQDGRKKARSRLPSRISVASVKDVPTYAAFLVPMVRELRAAGGTLSNDRMSVVVPAAMRLPDEILDIPHGQGRTEIEYRLAWGRTHLKNAGVLENSRRSIWSLTQYGDSISDEEISDIPRRLSNERRLIRAARTDPHAAYEAARLLVSKLKAGLIKGLDFSSFALEALPPIDVPSFDYLIATETRISNIYQLTGVGHVNEIYLQRTNITDISPISQIKGLQELDISQTKVSDISPIKSLKKLVFLNASECPIYDWSPISRLTQLQILVADNSGISDLSILSHLRNLSILYATGARVRSVEPLSKLDLDALALTGNDLDDKIVQSIVDETEDVEAARRILAYLRTGVDPGPLEASSGDDEQALVQRPAPYSFAWKQNQLHAVPQIERPFDAGIAAEILEALREKAFAAIDALESNYGDPRVSESVSRFLGTIAQPADRIREGELLMRFRSLEADQHSYADPSFERERSVRAIIIDLVSSAEDLISLYPSIRLIEANRQALRFQADDVSLLRYRDQVESMRAAASASPLVAASVLEALDEGNVEIDSLTEIVVLSTSDSERALAIEKRASVAGLQALDVRNFASATLKKLNEELGPVAVESWREIKAAIPKGIGKGVEHAVAGGVKVAVASLAAALAGPLAGIGILIGSFVPLSRRASEAAEKLEVDSSPPNSSR